MRCSRHKDQAFSAAENNGNLVHHGRLGPASAQVHITSRLIDSLYIEAMLLADEARSYFDDIGRNERAGSNLSPRRFRLRIAEGDTHSTSLPGC